MTERFDWTGGLLAGSGTLVLPASSEWVISGGGKTLGGTRRIEHAGTATWTGSGQISSHLATDAEIVNTGTFDIQGDVQFGSFSAFSSTFTNTGLFRKSGGAGTTQVQAGLRFLNHGQVDVQSGTLEIVSGIFNQGETQTSSGSFTVADGTTLSWYGGHFELLAGTLVRGGGTIAFTNATFLNHASFSPGISPGVLSVSGDYQNAALEIELGDAGVGSGYDRLVVSGQAVLGDTLDVRLLDGFVPGAGSEFQILTAGSITGSFDTVLLPELPGDVELTVEYGATDVRLLVGGAITAPTAPVILSPADGAQVLVSGQPTDPFVVTWAASTDGDGDTVSYTWQVATTDNFTTLVHVHDAGTALQAEMATGDLAASLTAAGIDTGAAASLHHRVLASDGTAATEGPSAAIEMTRGTVVAVEDEGRTDDAAASPDLPDRFVLHGAYPNPFNPSTTIGFGLPEAATVRMEVFDAVGRPVATLVDGLLPAGVHGVTWQAGTLPSGVYLYTIRAGRFRDVRRMVLVK